MNFDDFGKREEAGLCALMLACEEARWAGEVTEEELSNDKS